MRDIGMNKDRSADLFSHVNLLVAVTFSLCALFATIQTLAAEPTETGEPLTEGDIISVEPVETMTEEELVELVGAIALYPDDLVAIILPASTYPLQIVEAVRFRERNDPSLEPDEDWDESIVALLNYPQALDLLNKDLTWTWSLGQAVLSQQQDVLSAITEFRQLAYDAGNLKSDDHQTVAIDSDAVTIKQADPEVIYVPYYEPKEVVVYQPRTVYYYYADPYPVYYYPYPYHHAYYRNHFWGISSIFGLSWHNHYVHHYSHDHYRHPYYGRTYHSNHFKRTNRYYKPSAHSRRTARHNYKGRNWQQPRAWRPDTQRTGPRPNRSNANRRARTANASSNQQRRFRSERNRDNSTSLAYGAPMRDPRTARRNDQAESAIARSARGEDRRRTRDNRRTGNDRQGATDRRGGDSASNSINRQASNDSRRTANNRRDSTNSRRAATNSRRAANASQNPVISTRSSVHRDPNEQNAVSRQSAGNVSTRTRRQIEQLSRDRNRNRQPSASRRAPPAQTSAQVSTSSDREARRGRPERARTAVAQPRGATTNQRRPQRTTQNVQRRSNQSTSSITIPDLPGSGRRVQMQNRTQTPSASRSARQRTTTSTRPAQRRPQVQRSQAQRQAAELASRATQRTPQARTRQHAERSRSPQVERRQARSSSQGRPQKSQRAKMRTRSNSQSQQRGGRQN